MAVPVLWPWLLAAAVPLAKKALIAVGIGVISYASIITALNSARDQVTASYGQIGGDVAQLLDLFGFGQFIGIVLGAIAARAAVVVVERLGRVAS